LKPQPQQNAPRRVLCPGRGNHVMEDDTEKLVDVVGEAFHNLCRLERELLSVVLANHRAGVAVCRSEGLSLDHFCEPRYRILWAAAELAVDRGDPLDVLLHVAHRALREADEGCRLDALRLFAVSWCSWASPLVAPYAAVLARRMVRLAGRLARTLSAWDSYLGALAETATELVGVQS